MQEDNETKAQQERADELHRQIDELLSGSSQEQSSRNPRQFIAERMREIADEKKTVESNDRASPENSDTRCAD